MRSQQQKLENDEANNVRVVLRIRPMLPSESERGESSNAHALPDQRTVMVTAQLSNTRKVESQQHRLDRVFPPHTSQIDFFSQAGVESFCDSALEGIAATVFCFGQTGSGKTYTMSGPITEMEDLDDHAGMQFRAAHYMARAVESLNNSYGDPSSGYTPIVLKASYIEIYNELINDLLNDTTNLKPRWSQAAQSFFIENLMIVQCDGISDLIAVLQEGNNNRKRASHKLNVDSSRSHVIFTMYIERRDGPGAPVKLGKINFVDLAGSEKLKDSESSGVHGEETKAINKSLFALGNVISCLAKSGKGETFIPYRDSTLTKLLMDSLGGQSKTLMVACITPSNRFTEESLRTITYALRTRNIVNANPVVRMDPRQQQMYELRVELEMLRKENASLRAQLQGSQLSAVNPQPPTRSLFAPSPSFSAQGSPLCATNASRGSFGAVMFSNISGGPPSTAQSTQSAPAALFPAVAGGTNFTNLAAQTSQSFGATNATVRSLPVLCQTPSSQNYPSYDTHQHAAIEIAEKVQKDNEELRREVSLLRNLVLNIKAPVGGKSTPNSLQEHSLLSLRAGSSDLNDSAVLRPPPPASGPQGTVFERRQVSSSRDEQQRDDSDVRAPSQDGPTIGDADGGRSSLTDFGFKPAPKKVQKLVFLS